MNIEYDVVIIGGGPAGLTAGLYTSRARLNSILIEKGLLGGQIANAEMVENFPGFPDGIDGSGLCELIQRQATKYGLKLITAEVSGIELPKEGKVLKTTTGDLTTRAIIVAGGSQWQKLGIPGEAEFTGKGISYCATCDAPFFREQAIAVVGGGNTAISEALYLTKFAAKVTVIHRRDQLRATGILRERAFAEPKIDFRWDSVVESIEGGDSVRSLKLRNVKTGEQSTLEVNGAFIAVGLKPDTEYLKGILSLDPTGHIITNEKMETSVPGIYAAGDIRANAGRQAITAAGDGATAAIYAEKFLANY